MSLERTGGYKRSVLTMNAVDSVNKATLHYLFHYKSQGPSDGAFRSQAGNKLMAVMQVLVNLRALLAKACGACKRLTGAQEAISQLLRRKIYRGLLTNDMRFRRCSELKIVKAWEVTWGKYHMCFTCYYSSLGVCSCTLLEIRCCTRWVIGLSQYSGSYVFRSLLRKTWSATPPASAASECDHTWKLAA